VRILPRYSTCPLAAALLGAAVALGAWPTAHARPLAEIKERGALALCANPNALPHASDKPDRPGFQIEIARAVAQRMGVTLTVDWIVPRSRASNADCDMLLDTIAVAEIYGSRVRLSIPYQRSGVALGVGPRAAGLESFADLKPGVRVGVMVNSVASVLLGKRELTTVPYAFEDEMVEDLASGKLDAAASSPAPIGYYRHTHPEANIRLVHAYDDEPELAWNVAIGLRRADDGLVEAVNRALGALLTDGTIARIYAGYGIEHRAPK
jgi:polar amino acid transport system substrate-binding protein